MTTAPTADDLTIYVTNAWPVEKIVDLVALWDEGLPTQAIADRMRHRWGCGITKNAIVGKAHRTNLMARPSPIIRTPGPRPKQPYVPRPVRHELPPLPSAIRDPEPLPPRHIAAQEPQEPQEPPPEPVPETTPAEPRRPRECCWPIGEPGKGGFHFCDAVAELGSPYCAKHHKHAYVPITERKRTDARILRHVR